MLGTSLIPYAEAFISPILGLIWPENGENIKQLLKEMEDKPGNLMDEKIQDADLATIHAKITGMNKNLKEFENSLNGNIPQYFSQGDVASLNRGVW